MRLGIMQPYFFPYIGYFQLIAAVDKFVILDDVAFIKKGWITRNRILVNGIEHMFTLPLVGLSQNRLINGLTISSEYSQWSEKFQKTLRMNYGKAPFFNDAYQIINNILIYPSRDLSDFLLNQLMILCEFLQIHAKIITSSSVYNNRSLRGEIRIKDICLKENADQYINLPGGMHLYQKDFFEEDKIELKFIAPFISPYHQNSIQFHPALSIIDLMMNLSSNDLRAMVNDFKLN